MTAGPYEQRVDESGVIHRVFAAGVDDVELKWHRDDRSREVTFVTGGGWSVQLEGDVPMQIVPGRVVFIPKLVWHRLIHEGGPDLHVRIREM